MVTQWALVVWIYGDSVSRYVDEGEMMKGCLYQTMTNYSGRETCHVVMATVCSFPLPRCGDELKIRQDNYLLPYYLSNRVLSAFGMSQATNTGYWLLDWRIYRQTWPGAARPAISPPPQSLAPPQHHSTSHKAPRWRSVPAVGRPYWARNRHTPGTALFWRLPPQVGEPAVTVIYDAVSQLQHRLRLAQSTVLGTEL